ncbi:MAG: glycosyltransferase [Chloroflexota bacterium]|nr:MAG: glycosyltransferase [Chloroflexota bacterium]
MTKILFLTPQLPYPPEQGTSLRNFNILRGLLEHHSVTLLSFANSPMSGEAMEQLAGCEDVITVPSPERSMATRVRRMLSDSRPDMAHRLQSAGFVDALTKKLKAGGEDANGARPPFDVLQVEGIEMAYCINHARSICPDLRILFDDHNAEYELQRRAYLADRDHPGRWPAATYSRIQTPRLQRYERWACNSADHVVAVSEEDRRLIEKLGLKSPISVIPNSIDVADYAPDEAMPKDIDLLFVGKMDYRPNVDAVLWFADAIWPRVRQERPNVSWAVVGREPHSRLQSIARQEGVTITGRVERIQPYFQRSRLFIMPFRVGSGTRLKLIEAMASGLAIISTAVGAEGFSVRSGEQLLIAEEPEDFAAAILELLDDRDRRLGLGEQAQRFALQYDWRRVTPRFIEIYEELLAERELASR